MTDQAETVAPPTSREIEQRIMALGATTCRVTQDRIVATFVDRDAARLVGNELREGGLVAKLRPPRPPNRRHWILNAYVDKVTS